MHIGGAETMLVDIVNEQAIEHDVTLIVINKEYNRDLLDTVDKRVNIKLFNRRYRKFSVGTFIKLNLFLQYYKPDVVHVHNESLLSIIPYNVAKGIFLTVHTTAVSIKNAQKLTHIFAISDTVKDDIIKKGIKNVTTVANGINIDRILKRNNKAIIPGDKMRIVQVARFQGDIKGQDILIKALALLRKKGLQKIEVDFIGYGDSEEENKYLAKEYGVDDLTNFLGMRDRNYIYTHLKEYDLMCHPARIEGFGLTVAEGIAAMLPVLVPDINGPYEIIDFGKLGYVFKQEDVQDCADKIEYIYYNYEKALGITHNAYNKVEDNYTIKQMINKYMAYYYKYI